MPIVMALADQAGLRDGDPGRIGLALAVGFGTFMLSTSILPANVPNQVMAGTIETSYGLHLAYLPYLVLHAPVLGLLKGVALAGCVCVLFPGRPQSAVAGAARTRLSSAERRLAILLLLTLILWSPTRSMASRRLGSGSRRPVSACCRGSASSPRTSSPPAPTSAR